MKRSDYTFSKTSIYGCYSQGYIVLVIIGIITLLTGSELKAETTYNLTPINNQSNVNPDTRLIINFDKAVVLGNSGLIRIFDASNNSLVDSLDLSVPPGPNNTRTPSPYDTLTYSSIPNVQYSVYNPDTNRNHIYQLNHIGGITQADAYHFFPVILNNNTATICPHNNSLDFNKTYYVTIEPEVFPFSDGSFKGILDKEDWVFSTKISAPSADTNRLVVAADGTGDFSTVQGAIDFIPENNTTHKTIFVKNGIYDEIIYFREKENITILGEDREKVIIQYANNGVFNYKDLSPDPDLSGLYHNIRAVFSVQKSSDISLANFTIISLGERPAQAEGLLIKGERLQVQNVNIIGSGDALQTTGTIFLSETSIKGYGDNILGYGAVFFNDCELISTYGPHLWVRNTDANHGNIFLYSKFWTEGDVETDFARAPTNHGINYPYVEAVLINCAIEGIRARGWGDVGPERDNIHYWEYNSTNLIDGKPADVSNRASYSRQLNMEGDSLIIANYSDPAWVLNGWTPQFKPVIYPNPDTISAVRGTFVEIDVRVAAAPIPKYRWFKNGMLLLGKSEPSLKIDSVSIEDEGIYSVSIENSLGYDSVTVVTLVTEEAPVVENINSVDISPLRIFPNPAKDILNIEHNNMSGTIHGLIYSMSGKELLRFHQYQYNDGRVNTPIDVSSLAKGIYILKINNSTQSFQQRFCIVR